MAEGQAISIGSNRGTQVTNRMF